jgi:hypothetical protein
MLRCVRGSSDRLKASTDLARADRLFSLPSPRSTGGASPRRSEYGRRPRSPRPFSKAGVVSLSLLHAVWKRYEADPLPSLRLLRRSMLAVSLCSPPPGIMYFNLNGKRALRSLVDSLTNPNQIIRVSLLPPPSRPQPPLTFLLVRPSLPRLRYHRTHSSKCSLTSSTSRPPLGTPLRWQGLAFPVSNLSFSLSCSRRSTLMPRLSVCRLQPALSRARHSPRHARRPSPGAREDQLD